MPTGTPVVTPYAILSFPNLFAPRPRAESGEPVYGCALLFDEEAQATKEYKKLEQVVAKLFAEKYPGVKKYRSPFLDAAEKQYAGYEAGMTYISPWSSYKPGVVDVRLRDVLDPAEVYAGQIVRAHVMPFAWLNSGKHGVSFGLNHIQIVKKDAPRIDGRASARHVFTAIEEDDDSAESLL